MESLKVDPARLQALSESLKTNSKQIEQALETLDGKIDKLRSEWSGESQAAYDQAQRRWSEQLTEMNRILSTISGKTSEIAASYVATDAAAAKRFSV